MRSSEGEPGSPYPNTVSNVVVRGGKDGSPRFLDTASSPIAHTRQSASRDFESNLPKREGFGLSSTFQK